MTSPLHAQLGWATSTAVLSTEKAASSNNLFPRSASKKLDQKGKGAKVWLGPLNLLLSCWLAKCRWRGDNLRLSAEESLTKNDSYPKHLNITSILVYKYDRRNNSKVGK